MGHAAFRNGTGISVYCSNLMVSWKHPPIPLNDLEMLKRARSEKLYYSHLLVPISHIQAALATGYLDP